MINLSTSENGAMRNIPIKVLKEFAKKYGYSHVIMFASGGGKQFVATYGQSIHESDQAAQFGDMLKDTLGWPESLHAMTSRVRMWQKRIQGFDAFHPRAVILMENRKNFLVVAEDEPYFLQVYSLIRSHELVKGTWTEDDEMRYQAVLAENAPNSPELS
jgi:hypothetical protein